MKETKRSAQEPVFCLDFNKLAPSPVSWPSTSLLGMQCFPCMVDSDENDRGDGGW